MGRVIIQNDSIGGYQKGLEIVNQVRETATPTISNLRIRNSSNSTRTDTYGIVLTGSVNARITDSEIEEAMYGIYYSNTGIIQRETPTLSNLRIRNSSNSTRAGSIGIYLNGLSSVIVDNDSIYGFAKGIVIDETTRSADCTPTLSNLRIRSSSNSNRTDTIGILLQGSVDARITASLIDEFDIGISYLRQQNRAGSSTTTLSNLRIRNSSNSSRLASVGMYLDNLQKVIIVNDSIEGYPTGVQFHTSSRTNASTPTISNLRVRNSSNSSRISRNVGTGLILEHSLKGAVLNSYFENFATGIVIPDNNRMQISDNSFKNCTIGIDVNGADAIPQIHRNRLYLSSGYLLSNPGTANWAFVITAADTLLLNNNTIYRYSHALKLVSANVQFHQNIVWNTTPNSLPVESLQSEIYSAYNDISYIAGIYPGFRNINVNPLFVNPEAENFGLLVNSPCIDAGEEAFGTDADGTRPDLGALPYLHKADFSTDHQFETVNEPIHFMNTSIGHDPATSSYAWDFNNDGVWDSYLMNPVKSYSAPGLYSVKMRVQTSTLSDSTIKINVVIIQNTALPAPQNIQISKSGNNTILNWEPVTHNLLEQAVSVDFYLIYQAASPAGPFNFLDSTPGVTHYVHTDILAQNRSQFYIVLGFVGSREQLRQYLNEHRSLSVSNQDASFERKPVFQK
jgi:PKD repeat protein/nitrous oxidase accessory protein NosD